MKTRPNRNQDISIKTLRKALLNKKEELLTSIGINSSRVIDAQRTSEEDAITVVNDEFLQLNLNRARYVELRQVESALALLKLGEHGTCAECHALISPKRLQAIPWATYCVNCQDKTVGAQANEFGSMAIQN